MAKQSLRDYLRRARNKAGMRAVEAVDLVRRRKTEAPHMAAQIKKSHVLIQKPEKITVDGNEVFQARFVKARLGSQFNPFPDHITATAIQNAVHQTVISSLKTFRGMKGKAVALTSIDKFKVRKSIPPKAEVLIRVMETQARKSFLRFECKAVDAEDPDRVFVEGTILVNLVDKKAGK